MDFGVHLPQLGRSADRRALITWAEEADRLGLHSGWVSDHIAWPRDISSKYPYTDDGSFPGGFDMPWLDPLGTLMFVAARTERLRLGTTVLILGYRPPVLTAKWMATLDVLSEGRAILGVGVGWMREEFEVIGMPFDHRGARADEQLEVFEALFTQPTPSYDGSYYAFEEVGFSPKPRQEPLPIWVGGNSEAAYRRTARFGEAFHAAFEPIETVTEEWAAVGRACDAIGRDRGAVSLSVRMYLDADARMAPEVSVQGTADEMADTIGRWRDIGVTHILLDVVAGGGSEGRLDALRAFMTEVAAGH
ncbi:MAG: LLM class F420-dependent oxidoreductase [Acidimicrobiia bacterium]|nr:LLM class F420-dependent oxidoreductase [Acidimicrobiia bacterium]